MKNALSHPIFGIQPYIFCLRQMLRCAINFSLFTFVLFCLILFWALFLTLSSDKNIYDLRLFYYCVALSSQHAVSNWVAVHVLLMKIIKSTQMQQNTVKCLQSKPNGKTSKPNNGREWKKKRKKLKHLHRTVSNAYLLKKKNFCKRCFGIHVMVSTCEKVTCENYVLHMANIKLYECGIGNL